MLGICRFFDDLLFANKTGVSFRKSRGLQEITTDMFVLKVVVAGLRDNRLYHSLNPFETHYFYVTVRFHSFPFTA